MLCFHFNIKRDCIEYVENSINLEPDELNIDEKLIIKDIFRET